MKSLLNYHKSVNVCRNGFPNYLTIIPLIPVLEYGQSNTTLVFEKNEAKILRHRKEILN